MVNFEVINSVHYHGIQSTNDTEIRSSDSTKRFNFLRENYDDVFVIKGYEKLWWKYLRISNGSEFLYFYLDKKVITLGYVDMNMQRELVWIRLSDKLVK